MYADDTQYYFAITTIQNTTDKIDEIMVDIKNWMIKKKLKLNENKTECMLFGTEYNLRNYAHVEYMHIGTSKIKVTPLIKNLGVYIDRTLTLKNQILNTVKTCNYHLRNIAFIRKYLNEDTVNTLIHNHIISRLDYCNSLYYGLPNNLLKKLQIIQNKAARLVKGIPRRDRITPILIKLHWLPIKARIVYKICLLTYKTLKTREPKYLLECLTPFQLGTNISVRHANDKYRLHEPRFNRNIGSRTYQYSAPRLYNNLPVSLKDSENIVQFKKNLKTYLFEKTYDMEFLTINEPFKV